MRHIHIHSFKKVFITFSEKSSKNLAIGKSAIQSSQYRDGSAIKAIDGDKSSDYSDHSCMHTELEFEPWWRLDLGDVYEIQDIILTNRNASCGMHNV